MAKTKLIKPDKFVVKSNALVEARYRLSLQESHVILWLLTQIRPDDEDFKLHTMRISEFSKMVGVKVDNQYKELRKITETLMKKVLNIYEPETKEWLQVSWLSAARYKTKKGVLSLEFSPQLKPYLLQLKSQFTKIDIADTLKFKSIYAVRMFELLLQYEPIGKREISVNDLRSYCGIEKTEYALYGDLKRYAINRAKTEINTKTEYEVDYKELKESRKVSSIEFSIKKKTHFEEMQSEKVILISKELRSKQALIEQLIEYGFTKQGANRILKHHEETHVTNAIKAVDIQVQKGKAKNPKAMINRALKEMWHPEVYKTRKKVS